MEILLVIAAYMLPTLVAALRKKRNTLAIGALNVLLGWTFIGWVVALVWSLASERDAPSPNGESGVTTSSSNSGVLNSSLSPGIIVLLLVVVGALYLAYLQ
ncbi:superinfection immunity protein [Halomonas elongata]|uniref:superinfection immunity protein n=1 Tax=Halomonas elongata TaxID=2746 RepID=UPI00186BA401|nr:superinfection immunity protein [Halomonas elongata]